MNATLKVLIVWLMLLAVPVQGFAAATSLWCAPQAAGAQALADVSGHDEVMAAGSHDAAAAHSLSAHHDHHHHSHHHADTKCNACAACCFGASMPPSFASAFPPQTPQFESIPFIARHSASADLALPDRPPRA